MKAELAELALASAIAELEHYTDEQLLQAAKFYRQSPDGQWDSLACVAITAILLERLKKKNLN